MPQSQMVCTRCGTIARPKRYTPGTFGMELLLFLFFIIPGLIYGIWRIAARKDVCAACLSDALVPIGSPAGRAMTSRTQARMSASGSAPITPALKKCPDCAEDVRAEARKCRFCGFIFAESADVELKPELSDTEPASATVSVEPTEQLQTLAPAPRPLGRVTVTKVMFALIIVALTYLSVVHHTSSPPSSGGSSNPATSPLTPLQKKVKEATAPAANAGNSNRPAPVLGTTRESKVMLYMSCLGFSTSAAARALKAADGDADKVLTMTHMAVSGDLSGQAPLNEREKTCLKSSGL